ncbi:unnamed protein product [Owenia fusiformis]|uniref:Dual oxidase maturation factor 1 n=1 Tax=Owenia fusiformis TaxID=6347 RepID=A0A8S4N256_OWEFU|nr:unnamed protein product [Owenia fusiformis]
MGNGWFDAWRDEGEPTYYSELTSPVTTDVAIISVVFACAIISAALLVAVIGTRGTGKWKTFIRVIYSLFIGISILLTTTGQGWLNSTVHTHHEYMMMTDWEMMSDISVKLGLNWVNITLSGSISNNQSTQPVYYNERFKWIGVSQLDEEYHDGLRRGLPDALLYIAEYFHSDQGGIRWTRSFREAGFYVYILLWVSFAFWVICNILLCMAVFYGAIMLALSGVVLITANILYHISQPTNVMVIPFEDDMMTFEYGWCFWLEAAAGVLALLGGIGIMLFAEAFPRTAARFFLIDTSHLDEMVTYSMDHLEKDKSKTEWYTNKGFLPEQYLEDISRVRTPSIFKAPNSGSSDNDPPSMTLVNERKLSSHSNYSEMSGLSQESHIGEQYVPHVQSRANTSSLPASSIEAGYKASANRRASMHVGELGALNIKSLLDPDTTAPRRMSVPHYLHPPTHLLTPDSRRKTHKHYGSHRSLSSDIDKIEEGNSEEEDQVNSEESEAMSAQNDNESRSGSESRRGSKSTLGAPSYVETNADTLF